MGNKSAVCQYLFGRGSPLFEVDTWHKVVVTMETIDCQNHS